MIKLRDYQIESVESIWSDLQDHKAVLLVMATGGGKTVVFLELVDRMLKLKPDARILMIAHRKELIEQPLERLESFYPHLASKTGVVMASQNDVSAQVVSATIQTLTSGKRLQEYLAHGAPDLLITDECFVSGTLVDGRPIESIGIGDAVTCVGPKGLITGKVMEKHVRPAPDTLYALVVNGRRIVCTGNHPFWTPLGWMPASSLSERDYVGTRELQLGQSMQRLRRVGLESKHRKMPSLRGISASASTPDSHLLRVRQGFRGEQAATRPMATIRARLLFSGLLQDGNDPDVLGTHGTNQSQVCLGAHDPQQSDDRSIGASQDERDAAPHWPSPVDTGRKRTRAYRATIQPLQGIELAYGGHCQDGSLEPRRSRLSLSLQARHSERGAEDWDRDRRRVSQSHSATGAGCQEGCALAWSRVDSVAILKRDSDGEYERLCPDGTVYNLGVSPHHNYLANGFLVHNCHHAAAKTYMDFYEALYAVNPALWHVGVTATPIRADGQGLKVAYEKVSATFDIRYLVKAKYLVPPRWLAIQTGISLEHVATRRGADGESDFVTKQLADVFETDNCFELVVESYRKYAAQRQAIAFTATVDGAYRLADKFKDAGISAEAADGATNKQDRSQILQRFRKGEVDVLCNVGLYTEGLDVPEVSCILNVRPTKSDGLYLQMIGRGLRIADWAGKHDCVILDFSPQDSRQVVFLGDVLGTPIRKDVYIKERKEPGEVSGGFTFDGEFKWLVGDPSEIVSRELDYLDMSPFSWYKRDGWMTLGLGPGPVDEHERILAVSAPNEDGQVTLWKISRARGKKHYAARRGETASLDIVLAITDEISEQYGNRTLAMRQKKWRKNQPSPASIGYAENLGTYLAGMNQGQVSDAITHGLAMRAIRQIEQGE